MKLIDLNRQGGIGANCLLLMIGELNILVDCGLNPKTPGVEALPDLSLLRDIELDLIIITHCHLDHIGGLPVLMRQHPKTPVLLTQSSRMLIEKMLHNSANVMQKQKEEDGIAGYPLFTHKEIERLTPRFHGLPFKKVKKIKGKRGELELMFHPSGHVAGATAVEIHHGMRKIFLTGDVLFDHLRTLKGAHFPIGHFDTLIIETTRGMTERAYGKERVHEIARLIDSINDTIARGGSFLLPVFALGRMQELLAVFHDARRFGRLIECPIYAGGLGIGLSELFDEVSRKTNDVQFDARILRDLGLRKLPKKLTPGQEPHQKGLYIVSSGMLVEKTPSYTLASGLVGHARNTVGFVGFCDPDTPGGKLLATKPGATFHFDAVDVRAKVRARVERFELSGHAERGELLEFAVQTKARSIVLTHGDPDARDWFKVQLAEQLPKARVVDPVPLRMYEV
ncbi:MBL fold metallo-hydrolase [Oleiharenicola lentus]|jgi:Cft2 family RNA processing exonuclease|uniref:MBL fold metallo-hydrolase n=1 Tax=Oleiharenicola lentus TaxID=2508720 RepID=A0A4Q1C4A7_9BACT|nr:MBL fold metallo-hydrolase [Oleiharenicola lentus]RXK53105.1 MBL fold metallo-hydrolase [Oleiharenicola lentus]